MIPVTPRAEPATFDAEVRKPGRAWLEENPEPAELNPYWRRCLPELHQEYGGFCAYVSLYIHPFTGSQSVDHFVAKSADRAAAYEWTNYRLACGRMNSRKRAFDDVLDPFELPAGTFQLNPVTGAIFPAPGLDEDLAVRAAETISRLDLDSGELRSVRTAEIDEIREGISARQLKRSSPFVVAELIRQGLFKPEDEK